MKNQKIIISAIMFVLFLYTSIAFSEKTETETFPFKNPSYWYDRKIPLKYEEFLLLAQQLEDIMLETKRILYEMVINGNTISGDEAKFAEECLEGGRKEIDVVLKSLYYTKENPNSMSASLGLFSNMIYLDERLQVLRIYDDKKCGIDNLYFDFMSWSTAFLNSHLFFLAFAKDENRKLYTIPKPAGVK
ncbi:MAG: hypothetical protein E3K37_15340 [Candidatus Kuenenia sp.]|nr:hypothetical protein [Candidatus Kuenenia hertensis]